MNVNRKHYGTTLVLSILLVVILVLSGCQGSGCTASEQKETSSVTEASVPESKTADETEVAIPSGTAEEAKPSKEAPSEPGDYPVEDTSSEEPVSSEAGSEGTEETESETTEPATVPSDAPEESTSPGETKSPYELPERPA